MARLQLDGKKAEAVKKLISTASPTGGTMGAKAAAARGSAMPEFKGEKMDPKKPLKEVVIQSTRIPKVEDETEEIVKIGSRSFKKEDVEAMLPQIEKIFKDEPYLPEYIQNIKSALSGKPKTSTRLEEKDKYNKTNITTKLYEPKDTGRAYKVMGYLVRAGLGL